MGSLAIPSIWHYTGPIEPKVYSDLHITKANAATAIRLPSIIRDNSDEYMAGKLLLQADQEILLFINSYGGHYKTTMNIVKLLAIMQSQGREITCIADGKIYSGAAFIFSACTTRIITRNSRWMIHGPGYEGWPLGNVRVDARSLATLYNKEVIEDREAFNFLLARHPIPFSEFRMLYNDGIYLTGEELGNLVSDPNWISVVNMVVIE